MNTSKHNIAILMAIAAGQGYSMTGSMAETYTATRKHETPLELNRRAEKASAAMAKAEAKRQRKAAKRSLTKQEKQGYFA